MPPEWIGGEARMMGLLKRLEIAGKKLIALIAAGLFFRPGRKRLAPVSSAKRVLLVRLDGRVGEALLMTPLISSLKASGRAVDVLVDRRCVRVLEGHPDASSVIGFERQLGELRARAWDAVVDCGNWEVPSITVALVSRMIAPRCPVVGPAIWPAGLLHDVRVRAIPGERNELTQRLHLLSPLVPSPSRALSFRTPRSPASSAGVVINPGGRLDWRRVPPSTFASAARAAIARGRQVVVTWGPGEEALARSVAEAAPGASLAPATNLDELAALMRAGGEVITNNTGPMHLAVAVGARVLAFFMKMEVERWGYPEAPHRMVDLTTEADPEARAAAETAAFLGS